VIARRLMHAAMTAAMKATMIVALMWQQGGLRAQTFETAKLEMSEDGSSITLSGAIGPGTGRAFAAMLKDTPNLHMVRLQSPSYGGIWVMA
jgi:hypothetical protein